MIFCLPSTTSARKLMRSMSPLSSQVVSIRMPGSPVGRDRQAVHPLRRAPCGRTCRVFSVDVLHRVDRGVALDAVVVGHVLEALLELLPEFLHRLDRRVGSEADMTLHAVGGVARQVDHLLAEQGGLADQAAL